MADVDTHVAMVSHIRHRRLERALTVYKRLHNDPEKWAALSDASRAALASSIPAEMSADECKDAGNRFFAASDMLNAMCCYHLGVAKAEELPIERRNRRLLAVLFSNAAAAHEACGNWEPALQCAELAVAYDGSYLKGYYRAISACVQIPAYCSLPHRLHHEYLALAFARANASADASFMSSSAVQTVMAKQQLRATISVATDAAVSATAACDVVDADRVPCVLVSATSSDGLALEQVALNRTDHRFDTLLRCELFVKAGIGMVGVAPAAAATAVAAVPEDSVRNALIAELGFGDFFSDVILLRDDKKPLVVSDVEALRDFVQSLAAEEPSFDWLLAPADEIRQRFRDWQFSYNDLQAQIEANGGKNGRPLVHFVSD